MARKFLQMGYTRSRRYAVHRDGRKYGPHGEPLPPRPDPAKAQSAEIFAVWWRRVREDPDYRAARERHRAVTAAAPCTR